jgi:hypothetical protein
MVTRQQLQGSPSKARQNKLQNFIPRKTSHLAIWMFRYIQNKLEQLTNLQSKYEHKETSDQWCCLLSAINDDQT